jgi:hypothetical protein
MDIGSRKTSTFAKACATAEAMAARGRQIKEVRSPKKEPSFEHPTSDYFQRHLKMTKLKNNCSKSNFKNIYLSLSSESEKHENYQYHSHRPFC